MRLPSLIFLFSFSFLFSTNYYVETTGIDNATCSQTDPCEHIQTAINLTNNGDVVIVYGSSKLALASLPVISYFNKFGGATSFIGQVAGTASEDNPFRYNFNQVQGSFGHKVMKVDTIHGDLTLVREPLFRGFASGFCMMVDLDHVSYRPLVGNGMNRDTHITTNVQQADEDLRKDMILTEAGLEVSLPETHALINLEGV